MGRSEALTVEQYLDDLPDDRRRIIAGVREMILKNLPAGYRETMNWGMISYEIPLEDYPDTYNKQPLSYVALASQKSYCALYLPCVYQSPEQDRILKDEFKNAGKKLDMGKSCIRFKQLDDLPLDALGRIVASTPPPAFIAGYEESRKR